MSLVYWLSKFSQEALLVELFLISLIAASYFGYLLLKKKKYGAAKHNIPDTVVRAYLMDLISNAEGFKNQLFGENLKIPAGSGIDLSAHAPAHAGPDAASVAQIATLQGALTTATARQEELHRTIAQLEKDKADLAAKAQNAGAAPTSAGGDTKALGELKDKVTKLESRLAEYEVIEDDLANLKRYQQENKQLRAEIAALKGIPLTEAPANDPEPKVNLAAEPAAAAQSPEPSALSKAEETVSTSKAAENFDALAEKVEETLAAPAPAGASAADPVKTAQVQTAPATSDTAAAPTPAAAAPAAAPPSAEKSDADLLSEFERMLNS